MVRVVLGVEGMACGMCEAHVSDCLRNNFGGQKVKANRGKKQAEFLCESAPSEEAVRAAIEQTGYSVTSFTVEEYHKRGLFG